MKDKIIKIILGRKRTTIPDVTGNNRTYESFEIVSITNAISVAIIGGINKSVGPGDTITTVQAQGLVDDGCYDIVTVTNKNSK